MFNKAFKDKKVVFLGDSGVYDGRYLHNMRAYMHDKEDRCYLINRGIGGNRADMIDCLIEDEVFSLNPDYCFICFGVNDMGAWLYDSRKEITPEILEEREKRDQSFYEGNRRFIKYCKDHGVKPVLMPAYMCNEDLAEVSGIKTLGDNKEKAQLLDSNFYKRQNLKNINDKLRVYSDFLRELAKQEKVDFIDLFEISYKTIKGRTDVWGPDAVHMTDRGHQWIAKLILEYLGYENVGLEFTHGEGASEVWTTERRERNPYFIIYNMFNAVNGTFTEEEKIQECKKLIAQEGQEKWLIGSCNAFINDRHNLEENKKAYLDAVMKY